MRSKHNFLPPSTHIPQYFRKFLCYHKEALSRSLPVRKEADSIVRLENPFNDCKEASLVLPGLERK